MNALGLFVTIFFLRMNVCYLHGSTWILDETLDENTFYEICMNVWSHRWMYKWMNPDFLYDYFFRIYEFVNDF